MRLRIVLAVGIVIALALCIYKFRASDDSTHRKIVPVTARNFASSDSDGKRYQKIMESVPDNALKDFFVVIANDDDDLAAFLDGARKEGLDVRKSVESLGIALVCVPDEDARKKLVECIPARASMEYDYITFSPDLADAGAISGAEPLGTAPGVATGCPDDVGWGRGVSLAVLDMKVLPHPALAATSVVLFDDNDLQNAGGWHATSMASIVCGQEDGILGIARGVKLMNFVVMGGNGRGDSFSIAKGIADAVNAGAAVICVQSATEGDARAVELAVHYAKDHNALIVAPLGCAGNKLYPASIDEVLSVGAVDGAGDIVGRDGVLPDLYAPGAGIAAAVQGGTISGVNGSGAAAMIVAGAISGLMYENHGMSVYAAVDLIREYADRSGLYQAGEDVGVLNVDRTRNRTIQGLRDMAITGVDVQPNQSGGESVRVAVQNKGTAMTGFSLEVTVGGKVYKFSNQGLRANEFQIFTFDVPVGEEGRISAVVSTQAQDRNPDNNVW
jgi:hypothetical protein